MKIVVNKDVDLIINTFKRTDLVLFLMETFKIYKYPNLKRKVEVINPIKKNIEKFRKITAVQVKKEELKYHKELIDGYMNGLK